MELDLFAKVLRTAWDQMNSDKVLLSPRQCEMTYSTLRTALRYPLRATRLKCVTHPNCQENFVNRVLYFKKSV